MRAGIVLLVRAGKVTARYDWGPGVERYQRQPQRPARRCCRQSRSDRHRYRGKLLQRAGANRRSSFVGLQEYDQALYKQLMEQPMAQTTLVRVRWTQSPNLRPERGNPWLDHDKEHRSDS